MKKVIITVGVFLFSLVGFAQDELRLDIEAAKRYALENNRSIQSAFLDTQKSKYAVQEAIGQGLPQVSAKLDYNTYFNYEAKFSLGASSGLPSDQLAALDNLMYAGSIQEQKLYELSRPMLLPSEPSTIKMAGTSTAVLQVSQLIFSGQYWSGIQLAKLGKALQEKNLVKIQQEIANTITQSYYVALITEKSVSIIDSNIINMQNTLKNTENLYTAGVAESTDVDQIKMALSMLNNTKKSLERNVELNYNILKMQLGANATSKLVLTSTLEEVLANLKAEQLVTKDFNVQNHIDYQLLQDQEHLVQRQLSMQKWSYAPTVAGFYSYNGKLITTDFDMNPNHVAGFSVSVPIFTGGVTRAKVSQAEVDLAKSTLTKNLVEDQLRIQEQQLRFNLINAFENYQNQKDNVALSKRVYDNIEKKYNQGIVSTMDLTQANDNYLSAQNNYLSSIMDMLQAKQQLEYLLMNSK